MATYIRRSRYILKASLAARSIQVRTMASSTNLSLAILDDYAGVAPQHFQHIGGLKVDSYPETLDPTKSDGLSALVTRLKPYQIISTMRERTPFPVALQNELPNLKLLMTTSVRNASIDMNAATEQGIIVTGTKGDMPKDTTGFDDLPPPASASSVNQHAWALLLGLCSRLPKDDHALRNDPNAWQSGLMIPLGAKTLGVLGLGKLGALMAKTAVQAFGMKVMAWSENLTQQKADVEAEEAGLAKGTFRVVSKEELFREADVISLHLVLSERTKGVIGEKELSAMKQSAIIVNTSRGGLIDEEALLETLREGKIRGAALDVYWEEPLPPNSPWRSTKFKSEVVLSPHMGYVNAGTINRWYQEQAEIVDLWMQGKEVPNRIN